VKSAPFAPVDVAPGETVAGPVPVGPLDPGAAYLLNIRYALAAPTLWADAGHEVAAEQFILQEATAEVAKGSGSVKLDDQAAALNIIADDLSVRFDKKTGVITSIKTKQGECIAQQSNVKGPDLNIYRTAIQNDRWFRGAWSKAQLWRTPELVAFDASRDSDGAAKVRVQKRYEFKGGSVDYQIDYVIYGNGVIQISTQMTPEGLVDFEVLPRVGLKLALNPSMGQVEWSGRGPHENYPDRKSSAFFGNYQSTPSEMFVPYLIPQHNGARSDVSRVTLSSPDGQGPSLTVTASEPFLFSALHFDELDYSKFIRPSFLKERDEVILCIDHKMLGLGNASCGPRPLPEYMLPVQPYQFDLTIQVQ
jgi:beta-galactosidase